jgi:3-hydroxybenzoate 6-monooxygenase
MGSNSSKLQDKVNNSQKTTTVKPIIEQISKNEEEIVETNSQIPLTPEIKEISMLDFLIVGGGIAGVATALSLTKKGYQVKVFEETSRKLMLGNGCAISLTMEVKEILKKLGCSTKSLDDALHTSTISYHDSIGDVLKVDHTSRVHIPYVLLYDILTEAIPSEEILNYKCCIENFKEFEDHVEIQVDNETFKAKFLIIADGCESKLRSKFLDVKVQYTGIVRHGGMIFDVEKLENYPNINETTYVELGEGYHSGIQMVSGKYLTWWVYKPKPSENYQSLATFPEDGEVSSFLEEMKSKASENLYSVLSNSKGFLNLPITELEPLNQWVFGRKLLIGDAAHHMTPYLGLGACLSIVDAYSLGNILEKDKNDIEKGLKEYEDKRIGIVSEILSCAKNCEKERVSFSKDINFTEFYEKGNELFSKDSNIIQ